jgi:D-alanyl-D-alanine carboxypeptidase/D-alanyl-D-alanine-endopeptidase (penicillin-binding protein 4)
VVGDESYFDSLRTCPGWKASFEDWESAPLSALAVDRGRYEGHVARRPALAAAGLFRRALRAAGISVGGPAVAARAAGKVVAYRMSPPLAKIIRFMDSHSDNFTAELLLKQLGALRRGAGTTARGADFVTSVLHEAGVPAAGLRLADGSGLSSLDRLTPRALATILELGWSDAKLRPYFVGSLAVAGRSGTLRHRLLKSPERGNVRAKTGTTDLASALSGYVRDRYAFVVLENGRPVAWWRAHAAQDRFVQLLSRAVTARGRPQ